MKRTLWGMPREKAVGASSGHPLGHPHNFSRRASPAKNRRKGLERPLTLLLPDPRSRLPLRDERRRTRPCRKNSPVLPAIVHVAFTNGPYLPVTIYPEIQRLPGILSGRNEQRSRRRCRNARGNGMRKAAQAASGKRPFPSGRRGGLRSKYMILLFSSLPLGGGQRCPPPSFARMGGKACAHAATGM